MICLAFAGLRHKIQGDTREVRHARLGLAVTAVEPDGQVTRTIRDAVGRPTLIDRPGEDDRAFFYVTEEGCGCGEVRRIDEGRSAGDPPAMAEIRASQFFDYDTRHRKVTRSVDQLGRVTLTGKRGHSQTFKHSPNEDD